MNYLIHKRILRTTVLIFIFALLAGCANYYSNDGKTAIKAETLPLIESQDTQHWQTNDVRVEYRVDRGAAGLSLSGTLYLDDRLYYSFPSAQYFHLYVNYLNENGRVVGSYDISPLIPYLIAFQDSFKLPSVPAAPAEAVAFVFSYRGTFSDRSGDDESLRGSDDWEVYYNPFTT